ncbi:hypothetical protein LINGRAHAP2_LOCUS24650 [Linum grandiflorum]
MKKNYWMKPLSSQQPILNPLPNLQDHHLLMAL